ncbi:MAG TPA: purine-binding chemotaxis protein CheW [Gammaproteobacteria bacterium]|nr:purine-binding chemotaxis protein CheW [Gammaproteobacteria bacterium]
MQGHRKPEPNAVSGVGVDDCWNRIGVWGQGGERCPELERVVHCINCKVYAASGRRLLDRAADPAYLAAWGRQLREVKRSTNTRTASILIFRIADEWLGFPASLFQEVLDVRPVHSLPHNNSPALKGLVNVRGELLLCVSLGRLLGIDRAEAGAARDATKRLARMVVIAEGTTRYVFPVNEVKGIHRYAEAELRGAPATVSHSSSNYLRGMLRWDGRQVSCLDPALLFAALHRVVE